jgi:hypothetical protein
MAWDTTGNSGTNPDNNFLGTTDNQPLVIKANATEALRVTPTGSIGVGTNSPQNRLHVGPGSSSIAPSRVNAVFASNNPDAGMAITQNSGVNVLLQASGAGGYIGTTSNHPLVLRTNDLDRVVVDTDGNLRVTGDVVLTNADCAEDFDIADAAVAEPGTVMVLGEEGQLQQSQQAYDRRVAGVISGAGNYRPAIVLDKQEPQRNRKAIALIGKVYCKVDATHAPIEVGDLLTTSATPGHAMKAEDPLKAFGAVIGKALRCLEEGQGLIPILIALQ